MPIHFAAAKVPGRSPACAPIARAMVARAMERVANDNGDGSASQAANDRILRDALRHFAQHGLGAAREARAKAEEAFFAGDRQGYQWWLGFTRTLDRRLARQAELPGRSRAAVNHYRRTTCAGQTTAPQIAR